ncbi:MAG: ABC transporter ATP-binding protein [Candidatus Cloacimonetes bacterium]|nr:ABC transporter ATP-binding protein [Candidatus Cloacimonadota bacterium]MDD2505742.1 ABC transporter ATP-binding protein [Candidatus Cloacimonadota bacterium]MDD4147500.1 ABC transporter ATP-binding protein [Candidatus Cloacimonadota bacterium]MDD4559164.1 ABC transporter ATP-binding protein [Candidatus Cloacimonadota bacterium]
MIKVQNLYCGYDEKDILSDVSFELPAAEFTALLGPNGAGKSTLLFALMGFLKARKGKILIRDKQLGAYSRTELAGIFAYIPQELHSEFDYSVADTVLMGRYPFMDIMQNHSEEDRELVDITLRRLELHHLRHRFLHQLSGGEKQRVYIARALVQQTPYILLDESLSQLDINYQLEIMRLLRSICSEEHKGILLISHNLNLSANYADRMLFIRNGSLLHNGKPDTLMQDDILSDLYGIRLSTARNPISGTNNIIYP